MRLPRVRFKLWVVFVAIAGVAVVTVVMMRPRPRLPKMPMTSALVQLSRI